MKKKIVCAMMCVAMAATALVGCGSTADNATDDSTDNATDEATDDTADDADSSDAAASTDGKVYYLNFKPEQADAWVELA